MKAKLIISMIIVTLIIAPLLTFTATAHGDETDEGLDGVLIPIPIVTTPNTGNSNESQPLTPEGNLNLVDDFGGDYAEEKQFITVETKNGNIFYLIVDRAGNSNNVHFLNLVDESDLIPLLEDDVEIPQPQPYIPPQADETPQEPELQPEESNSIIPTIVVLVIFAGGGALVYFKIIKPKQQSNSGHTTNIDEFEDDEEYEDLSIEDSGQTEPQETTQSSDNYEDEEDEDEPI
ncbi:MAG: DUF4366 domain-containing protein [Oscillospiraceae bacterium]|nr:DUF4366 domain-containing protein [Oscillospiraceae bacterium]